MALNVRLEIYIRRKMPEDLPFLGSALQFEVLVSLLQIVSYVFFIEFEGHLQDEKVAEAIKELEEQSILTKLLGSYPMAVL